MNTETLRNTTNSPRFTASSIGRIKTPHVPVAKPGFTADELKVLSCMARDMTREEMAVELDVPVNTIKRLYSTIFTKLRVSYRKDAVRAAIQAAVIPPL